MRKAEIRDGVNSIKGAIEVAKENMEGYFKPYVSIKEHLDSIQSIADEYGIETDLDYETVADDTLVSCIHESEYIQDIENQFEALLSDLEDWSCGVSEKKAEQIEEQYIATLVDIKEIFDVDSIGCQEDLESQLTDMLNTLADMEI